MYTPDNWIIVKIILPDEVGYKILAGWSGGYLHGNAWKMNSGITKAEEDGNYILFHGYSSSVYRCHKESETLRMNCAYIFEQLQEKHGDKIERIDYADFIKEFTPHSKE